MYLNCKDFSMLTGQTGLPPNQPTSRKVKNVHNSVIFQPIWLKFGMESLKHTKTKLRKIYPEDIVSNRFTIFALIHNFITSKNRYAYIHEETDLLLFMT